MNFFTYSKQSTLERACISPIPYFQCYVARQYLPPEPSQRPSMGPESTQTQAVEECVQNFNVIRTYLYSLNSVNVLCMGLNKGWMNEWMTDKENQIFFKIIYSFVSEDALSLNERWINWGYENIHSSMILNNLFLHYRFYLVFYILVLLPSSRIKSNKNERYESVSF